MTTKPAQAIFAAKNRSAWGRSVTLAYVVKHDVLALYRLASQLEATKEITK